MLDPKMKIARFTKPSRIIVADGFFKQSAYDGLCREFEAILHKGLKQGPGVPPPNVFWKRERTLGGVRQTYDAYICPIPLRASSVSRIFFSRAFYNWVNRQFEVPLLNDISGSFHHHRSNSEDGEIHTDYVTELLCRKALKSGLNQCFDRARLPRKHFVATRSIGIIYYLKNDRWTENCGGETAFFYGRKKRVPALKIAPLNNRLLAFEITPESRHAFRKNRHMERSNVSLFLYSQPEDRETAFGVKPYASFF